MKLHIHRNALYPSHIYARSCAGGHFFLGSQNFNNIIKSNGAIFTLSNIMKNATSSAVEEVVGELFHNSKASEPIIVTLKETGHIQHANPMQKYNSTTDSIVNKTNNQKGPKL